MKIEAQGEKVVVSQIRELGAASARTLSDQLRAVMVNGRRQVDIDLAETTYIDSRGLGALIAIQKRAADLAGAVRLLHPRPPVRQILNLTRMHEIFEISET